MLSRKNKTVVKWHIPRESQFAQVFFVWILPVIAIGSSAWGTSLVRGDNYWGYLVIVLAGIGTIGGQHWRQAQSKQRDRLKTQSLKKFANKFKSLIDSLSYLISSDQSANDAKSFLSSILHAGGNLFAQEDLRLIIYQFDPLIFDPLVEGEHRQVESPSGSLLLAHFAGRSDPPRRGFKSGTTHGDWIIERTESGALAVCSVADHDEHFNKLPTSTWQAFMAFPIRNENDNFGILIIDSQVPVKWTLEDQAVGSAIALVLSKGMELMKIGQADVGPEIDKLKKRLSQL